MTDDTSKALEEAHRLRQEGFRRRAERLCRRIPEGDVHRAEALCLLALILCEDGRHTEAAEASALAVKARPTTAGAYAALGDDLETVGNAAAASIAFRRLQMLDPDSLVGVFSLGTMLKALRDVEGARRSYLRSRVLAPWHPNIANNLGTLAFGQSDWAGAATHFVDAIRLEPRYVPALVNLGRTRAVLHQHADAVQLFRRAIVLDPTNVSACCEVAALTGEGVWVERALHLRP